MTQEILLLSLPQVCRLLNLSKASVYRLLKSGKFPKPVRLDAIGRKNFFRAADVRKYVRDLESAPAYVTTKGDDVATKVKKALKEKPTYVSQTVSD